jgi:hypothetical protein
MMVRESRDILIRNSVSHIIKTQIISLKRWSHFYCLHEKLVRRDVKMVLSTFFAKSLRGVMTDDRLSFVMRKCIFDESESRKSRPYMT